ncbi:pentapeptide repeat-containing protein [Poritiphilus flavus]|uniref:Pentapeptide repeat-containing protein n=1 Tax=Poritiphilus flavus TaxID=2697053 RepID=A0A6L9EI46_9FLAO|nr:pentapeptide repeat-containing protein [Poritiphilus flavus]NAS14332.1 hypothetical protein [Poritiphilus flavus]
MQTLKAFFLCFLFFTANGMGQERRDQLVGKVVDVNNRGIEGVSVQLVATGEIQFTDGEGKFKFSKKGGFVVGEPSYSFVLEMDGYRTVGPTTNIVVFGSGAINNLVMKRVLDNLLWITVVDGETGEFLEGVKVDIKGRTKTTNEFGKVSYDFSAYGVSSLQASFSKTCYKNQILEVSDSGDEKVVLVPNCKTEKASKGNFDVLAATEILDRAMASRDGSIRGQNEALEGLIRNGYSYQNANFDGISLAGAQLLATNFKSATFEVSDLRGTHFTGTTLDQAILNFAMAEKASFNKVVARETRFQYLQGKEATFAEADLYRSSFFLSDLSNTDFSKANLKGACLAFCNLSGANFAGADLTDAILYGSVLDKADFTNAIIQNTDVTGAVANSVGFSKEQKRELRRSAPFQYPIRLEIFGETRESARYDYKYPDFSAEQSKLSRLPLSIPGSLKFRDADALKPIGVLRRYSREGPNYINATYRFEAKFWDHAQRGNKLLSKLRNHIDFIDASIKQMQAVEGSGEELKAILSTLEKQVSDTRYKGPLHWDADSQNVLMLAQGVLRPEELKPYDWKSLALSRCAVDKSAQSGKNSWNSFYPEGTACGFLPPQHVELYKKWTLARAARLRVKHLDVPYRINSYKLGRLQSAGTSLPGKNQRFLFKKFKGTYKALAYFKSKDMPFEAQEFYLHLNNRNLRSFLKLPENTDRYYITLGDNEIPKPPKGQYSSDYYFDLVVRYTFKDISVTTLRNSKLYVLDVVPTSAYILKEGKVLWESPIKVGPLLDDGYRDD